MKAKLLFSSLILSGISFSQTTVQTINKQSTPIEETQKKELILQEEQAVVLKCSIGKQSVPEKIEMKEEIIQTEPNAVIQTSKKRKK